MKQEKEKGMASFIFRATTAMVVGVWRGGMSRTGYVFAFSIHENVM